ncbi:MAG: hypothetical protein CSA35_03270 [Dethiosulfovibrio peptidovorans]|nr:MAG: hypothetical protein CSA35_03270 [Dethiosulfovibrio peptidovorans]
MRSTDHEGQDKTPTREQGLGVGAERQGPQAQEIPESEAPVRFFTKQLLDQAPIVATMTALMV